ncbi:hypothetical protein ILUMI_22442 [Ignelater luminosus]|uniref:Uncharacterized protein n=1 Tax=Ignelater luminosus TaxID=2038154 RepID=A0A8K0CH50_IGNLU|nr:hypothetical protein ILUMI_22442 [Ignelater luminosus]
MEMRLLRKIEGKTRRDRDKKTPVEEGGTRTAKMPLVWPETGQAGRNSGEARHLAVQEEAIKQVYTVQVSRSAMDYLEQGCTDDDMQTFPRNLCFSLSTMP